MANAPLPDLGNISHVAATASGHNVFKEAQELRKGIQHHKVHQAKQAQAHANRQQAAANTAAKAQARAQAASQRQQTAQAKQTARAHAQGVKSGRVAPAQGAAPRTFAMPAGPQGQAAKAHAAASAQAAKTMQSQRNHAHGQAIQMQNQMNRQASQTQAQHARVMQQQINTAHGQALRMNEAMNKPTTSKTPKPAQPLAVQPRSKSFPQHQQPAGSSTHPLPNLSATETAKTGRENTFSVGSKNPSKAKTNVAGLAAMGSKLEEGLMTKKFPLPEPRKRV